MTDDDYAHARRKAERHPTWWLRWRARYILRAVCRPIPTAAQEAELAAIRWIIVQRSGGRAAL
jgi:hypothetical protein